MAGELRHDLRVARPSETRLPLSGAVAAKFQPAMGTNFGLLDGATSVLLISGFEDQGCAGLFSFDRFAINDGECALSTAPPYPISFSYRWIDVAGLQTNGERPTIATGSLRERD
jgi:hypothetical protein